MATYNYTTVVQLLAHTWQNNDVVNLAAGTYALTGTSVPAADNCTLAGAGVGVTTLTCDVADQGAIQVDTRAGVTIRDLSIDWTGASGATVVPVILIEDCTGIVLQDLDITGGVTGASGVKFLATAAGVTGECIRVVSHATGGDGFNMSGAGGDAASRIMTLTDCQGYSNKAASYTDGAALDTGGDLIVHGGMFYDNNKGGVIHDAGGTDRNVECYDVTTYGNSQGATKYFGILANKVHRCRVSEPYGGILVGYGEGVGEVYDCVVTSTDAAEARYGIRINNPAADPPGHVQDCIIKRCKVTGFLNTGSTYGWGIWANGATGYASVIECCDITNCRYGAQTYLAGTTVTNCRLEGGTNGLTMNADTTVKNCCIQGGTKSVRVIAGTYTGGHNLLIGPDDITPDATDKIVTAFDLNTDSVALRGGNCDGTGDATVIAGIGGQDVRGRIRKLRAGSIDIGPCQRQDRDKRNNLHPTVMETVR